MSGAKPAVSFDEMIQEDRQRRKNEELAKEIFGRSRPSINPRRDSDRKTSRTPSLASRVGVAKRSPPNTKINTQKINNPFSPPSRPSSAAAQIARTNRLASAVNNSRQANVVSSPQPRSSQPGPGLSIKGTAGPFVVEATNFAPGTTAADIESALQSVAADSNGASGMTSCRIMSTLPTVIAEMVFAEKHIADIVISTFNNQKADGRILHVYLKRSGPGSAPSLHSRKSEPLFITDPTPTTSSKDLFDTNNGNEDMEDVEMSTEPAAYENAREAANQDRRDRESRRAEPDVQDGRYGFSGEKSERSTTDTQPPSQPREDRNGGSRRDEDRTRDRDRDRRYDDSRYDRRDDRGSYHRREGRSDNFDNRGSRPSHYGNGAGTGGRGFSGPAPDRQGGGGGRMYSDDVMRGGRGGGPRGGYRGGYR